MMGSDLQLLTTGSYVLMPRAIWKALIEFRPLSVPVKLYPPVEDVRAHLHLLRDHRVLQVLRSAD